MTAPAVLPLRTEVAQKTLLYHFCRLRWPGLSLSPPTFERHLNRSLELYQAACGRKDRSATWQDFLSGLHAADWYLSCACLERESRAWELLFRQRANRVDCLLVDALRARAVRLFPGNEEEQERAVNEFWGHLLVHDSPERQPVLARYAGQAPLVPWLIRVFQNKVLSEKRRGRHEQPLPEDDLSDMEVSLPGDADDRWQEVFVQEARDWLGQVSEDELLLLGLRWRYRLSQREVAKVLGIHEGNVTRRMDKLRDRFLTEIGDKLVAQGWTGEDLQGFIQREMGSLLVDEPRLAVHRIRDLLQRRGKDIPETAE